MKKMRKLIPAVAMLLVSAVLLSTATFAWFTMNDEVTASGMQIQAKASGSLLISQSPFSSENLGTTDVEINATVKNLKPIAYNDTKAGDADDNIGTLNLANTYAAGWFKPVDNDVSNTVTGINNGDYETFTTTELAQFAFKEQFYIATAGDAMKDAAITIQLTSPVHPATGETHKAYSVALYVISDTSDRAWGATGDVDFLTATPAAILHVGEDETDARNYVDLEATIPSIAGTADGAALVGLKVIAYFYVDGALMSETNQQTVIIGYNHVAATGAYDANVTYYAFDEVDVDDAETTDVKEGLAAGDDVTGLFCFDGTKYTPATGTYSSTTTYYERKLAPLTDADKEDEDLSDNDNVYVVGTRQETIQGDNPDTGESETSYTKTVLDSATATSDYTYVRSADIPSSGSFLKLSFSAVVDETATN